MSAGGPAAGDPGALARLRHDLRTPLAVITGFGELLAGEGEMAEDERRRLARQVLTAAGELRAILDEADRGARS